MSQLSAISRLVASLIVLSAVPASAEGWSFGKGDSAIQAGARAYAKPAATVQDIVLLERAVDDAWETMALTRRHALFVGKPASLYGGYEERPNSVFAPGEKLITYIEPMGYAWVPDGDGYRFGITMDFAVKSPSGEVLAKQDSFQTFSFSSRFKNREVFVNVTLALDGLPPGDYVAAYTLRDKGGPKSFSFDQPFTIAAKN
ncbi:hypothetical protein G3T14_03560 [Methylobacterium sp. BTF04]|uniref:hypothetical protein n=1 Tax=Methylobacterium sp. BTF04 TaxID=2708300 RepID=UPI0013D4AE51|nr:hypothetical protein [Methylobacterium sp. BTF04]NEU11205.1 hypothetical protein [Methylobacterium sp. BTF04]